MRAEGAARFATQDVPAPVGRRAAAAWLVGLGVCLSCSLVAYRRILWTPFVIDDYYLLTHAPEGVLRLFASFRTQYLRPVVGVSLRLDRAVWGLAPFGYHLSNVLTHGLNTLLVAAAGSLLLRSAGYGRRDAAAAAWTGGALFLVLPSHTEAVAWISGRTDLIAACFCLASLCAYLTSRDRNRAAYAWLAALLFALAVFAKESVLPFPLALLCVEVFGRRGHGRDALGQWLPRVAPFFGILLVYLVVRRAVLGQLVGGSAAGEHLTFGARLLARTVSEHLGGSFAPFVSDPLALGLTVLVAIGIAILLARRGSGAFAACLLLALFAISLLPVVNIEHARHGEQERVIYLPSVFSTLLIGVLIHGVLARRRWAAWGVAAALVAVFGSSLDASCAVWNQAGELAKQVVDSALTLPARRLIVLDMPRDLRGAWMLGNGLDSAPDLYGWSSPRFVGTWVKVSLHDAADRVEIVREGDVWRMRLGGYASAPPRTFSAARPGRFLSRAEFEAHRAAYLQATGHEVLGADWVAVKPPPLEPGDRLAVYRQGRLEDVDPLPSAARTP